MALKDPKKAKHRKTQAQRRLEDRGEDLVCELLDELMPTPGSASELLTDNCCLLRLTKENNSKTLYTTRPGNSKSCSFSSWHFRKRSWYDFYMAVGQNQWYQFGVGEFTTHFRIPILVVGLGCSLVGLVVFWRGGPSTHKTSGIEFPEQPIQTNQLRVA